MLSLEGLDVEHLQHFRRALFNVLSAPVAELTFAQIVDGQPTSNVYAGDHFFTDNLPVMQHETLCPGSIEKTRAFRAGFDILSLNFKPSVGPSCLTYAARATNIDWLDYTGVSGHSARYRRVEAAAS